MDDYNSCYACTVGVWTGPESHSPGCPLADQPASDSQDAEQVVHRIYTEYSGDRAIWECSCGSGGSADADRVDLHSDKHIGPGDRRIDTSRPH